MPVVRFLYAIEQHLKSGIATEHTYRPDLRDLFDTILAPATAINEPRHERYGAPDFVIQQGSTPVGHVEAKDIGIDMAQAIDDSERPTPKTTNGKQLKRYRAALPNLLYTDGLEWHWFVEGERRGEPLRIATWNRTSRKLEHSRTADADLRALLARFGAQTVATVSTPRDLARRLAQIARWLREVIEDVFAHEPEGQGELHQQLRAFKQTLLPDLQPAAFADMYAQTIVYGLFAARMTRPNAATFTRFDAAGAIPRTNPFLRKLFQEIAGYDLDDRIAWLVDDCAYLLSRTDMASVLQDFGRATRQEDPVVHFYETFLQAYDSRLRETRGVYYTPEPVVSYLVRSVDALLRERFNMPAGLADERAIVLDPATGTATFLHAIIQQIHQTLRDEGQAGNWNRYVPEKLLPRVFGFELLMAPYTVAHLKLGLLLGELGYQFGSNERLRIFLTNAIADLPGAQQYLAFAQYIAEEGAQANRVKQREPVMVVIGNPPYSGHSANKGDWIDGLLKGQFEDRRVSSYYEVDGAPLGERNPKWLQDDYVKFLRFGQWRVHRTGEGVLAFITNNGYLDNPTFRGMRQSLLHEFDTIYILNLHGNSKKGERAPDGGPDENVFDIQQGVAIGIFVKGGRPTTSVGADHRVRPGQPPAVAPDRLGQTHGSAPTNHHHDATVFYADLWGNRAGKYAALAAQDIATTPWQRLAPSSPFYLFVPQNVDLRAEYEQGWRVTEMMPTNSVGIATARDDLTIHMSVDAVLSTVQDFVALHPEQARAKYNLGADARDWKVTLAQADLRDFGIDPSKIVPLLYRPFDRRFTYYTGRSRGFMCMPRAEVMRHMLDGSNLGFATTRSIETRYGYEHIFCADTIMQHHTVSIKEVNYLFPLYLYPAAPGSARRQASLLDDETGPGPGGRRPNLSPQFIADVAARLGLRFVPDGKGDVTKNQEPRTENQHPNSNTQSPTTFGPEDVFHYAYAVFHSPTYRRRYAEFLKIDFPRLPLTRDRALFAELARKGAALVDLHLLRLPGSGGVGGAGGATILQRPGQQGVRFPQSGTNRVEKIVYVPPTDQHAGRVRINDTQYFEGIDPDTWAMQIGGYQPLEKWLKDRRGHELSADDVPHYLRMVIALRETWRIMAEIDTLIESWPIE